MKRQILISLVILLFTAGFATADTIHVPGQYPYYSIQDAIDIAQNGDTIIIAPGYYVGTGFYIGKNITITGSKPDDPNVVAATIIDPSGEQEVGFELSGSGQCVLSGLTIANSYRSWVPAPDAQDPGTPGFDGYDSYGGGGINIDGNHVVANCIIRNCQLFGGLAGNGYDGDLNGYPDEEDPTVLPINDGTSGGNGGNVYGAGIYIGSGNPTIINCTIDGCRAIAGDAGASGDGLDADTEDPNLPGGQGAPGANSGTALGGGVYCDSGTSPTFENCIITNCEVTSGNASDGGDGGNNSPAIDCWGGNGGVSGSASGGGVYCDNGVNATLIDCRFIGNQAYGGNAGDGGDGGDNGIDGNCRGGHGGVPDPVRGAGVYCETAVNATFTNCRSIGNQAYGGYAGDGGDGGDADPLTDFDGGLGGLVETSFTVTESPQGNEPPESFSADGGGLYIATMSTATFTDCTFSDNVTRGSVSGLGGFPTRGIREQPRKNYRIPSFGAGIYCGQLSASLLTDCTLQGNWTTQDPDQYPGDLYPFGSHPDPAFQLTGDEYTGYGGGMCAITGSAELNNCQVIANNAPVGGGLYATAISNFHVNDCNFIGNSAYLGGGLFSIDNSGSISGCTISGNSAYDPEEDLYGSGGGLFSFSSETLVSDCIISENTTNGFGAGVYFSGETSTTDPVLKNCLVIDNEADIDGGGIYCDWYSEPTIINCSITGNEAKGNPPFYVGYGGGLYCSYESDVDIINTILWDNTGTNTIGPELAVETWPGFGPTTLTVSHCDVDGGQEEVWVDADSTLNWGTGNIDEDPLFVQGYYLSQIAAGQAANSPCVDAGYWSAEDLGLDEYTTRTDKVTDACDADMGYHYPPIMYDFDGDGKVNLGDLAILLSYWLEQDCNFPTWCEGTDLDRDTDVDFVDYAIFAQAYNPDEEPPPPDTDPPTPDPSEWFQEPYPISSSEIRMLAEIADDFSGGVQYQFVCVGGGGHSSDWQDSEEYTDTSLAPSTEYTYIVRTRDVYDNIGGYSVPDSATTFPPL